MAARDIVIKFTGEAAGLRQAAEDGEKAVGKFSDRTQKMATVGIAAAGAVGAAIVGSMKAGVEGLLEGAEAEAKFEQALSKAPRALQANSDAIKAYAESVQQKTRFSYEDALAADSMLVANDGVQKALASGIVTMEDLTRTTLDLATIQGVDAAAAAKVMGKALAQPEKAAGLLRKSGILLSEQQQAGIKAMVENGNTAGAQSLIYDVLREKVDGAAEAAGNTMAGKLERAQNAFGEMQEALAAGLIPVMETLTGWGLKISTWAQENPGKVKLVVIVLGSLAAVIGTVSLAIKAWTFITKIHTAAMVALNVVMFANPLGLFIAALAAVAIGVAIAYKKSDRFRAIVQAVGSTVRDAATTAVEWFGRIKDAAIAVGTGIASAFGNVAEVITAPYRAAFQAIRAAWNSTIGGRGFSFGGWDPPGPGSVPGISFRIPELAGGGPALRNRVHLVGERGPELFVPGRTGRVVPASDTAKMIGKGAAGPSVEVKVYIGDREIKDIVRTEVKETTRGQRLAQSAGALRTAPSWV